MLWLRGVRSSSLAVALAALALSCASTAAPKAPAEFELPEPLAPPPPPPPGPEVYRDGKAAVENRVASLLAQMTVEEKVAQTVSAWNPIVVDAEGNLNLQRAAATWPHGIGLLALPADKLDAQAHARLANEVQKFAQQKTRLGIPALIVAEALHGTVAKGATSFPQALALAATWDPMIVSQVFTVAAAEARALGVHQVLAPVVDVAREPRWGRTEETYGEDPYLVGELGLAAVLGFQGQEAQIGKTHVAATLKHFAGHGQPEGGRNTAPANIGPRSFREVHLWPFERIVKATKVHSVMASYNEVDGVPSHSNRWLLTEILRTTWGFGGYVLADLRGVQQLHELHHVVETPDEAARLALWAGVDLELANRNHTFPSLIEQVKLGRVAMATLDQAVARILTLKFRMQLFEDAFADPHITANTVGAAAHGALARHAGEKALVLLKNDRHALPLDETRVKRLAVIGPNAGEVHLGGYSVEPHSGTSLYAGLQAYAAGRFSVQYAEGVRITESPPTFWADGPVVLGDPIKNNKRIAEAVKVARNADVIVLALGENESTNREAWSETHLGDRTDLSLLGDQMKLVTALAKLNKPMVAVIIAGRPLELEALAAQVPAILCGFYLGQHSGEVVADALFGKVNPGGKLPVTFPRTSGQAPFNYEHKPSRVRSYLGNINGPLYPFGHGLSYTTFSFGAPALLPTAMTAKQKAAVTVSVTNTGTLPGDTVAQLYIRDRVASVTRPVKSLRGFQRVTLAPGQSKAVTFEITPQSLAFFGLDGKRIVEPGVFDIMVGESSENLANTTLTVTEQ